MSEFLNSPLLTTSDFFFSPRGPEVTRWRAAREQKSFLMVRYPRSKEDQVSALLFVVAVSVPLG